MNGWLEMITAYIMDTDSTEFRLETINDEVIDTGKSDLDDATFDLDAIDFFADTSPDKEK
jgi:hypothetical protein